MKSWPNEYHGKTPVDFSGARISVWPNCVQVLTFLKSGKCHAVFVHEYIHIQTNWNVFGQENIHGVTLSGQNGLWKTLSPL